MPIVVINAHKATDEEAPHISMLEDAGFEIRYQRDDQQARHHQHR